MHDWTWVSTQTRALRNSNFHAKVKTRTVYWTYTYCMSVNNCGFYTKKKLLSSPTWSFLNTSKIKHMNAENQYCKYTTQDVHQDIRRYKETTFKDSVRFFRTLPSLSYSIITICVCICINYASQNIITSSLMCVFVKIL